MVKMKVNFLDSVEICEIITLFEEAKTADLVAAAPHTFSDEHIAKAKSRMKMARDFNKYLFERYDLGAIKEENAQGANTLLSNIMRLYDENCKFILSIRKEIMVLDTIKKHFMQIQKFRTIDEVRVATGKIFNIVKQDLEKVLVQQAQSAGYEEDLLQASFSGDNAEKMQIAKLVQPAKYFFQLRWIREQWDSEAYEVSLKGLQELLFGIERSLLNHLSNLNLDQTKNLKSMEQVYKNVLDIMQLRELLLIGRTECLLRDQMQAQFTKHLNKVQNFIMSKTPLEGQALVAQSDALVRQDNLSSLNLNFR